MDFLHGFLLLAAAWHRERKGKKKRKRGKKGEIQRRTEDKKAV